MGRQPVPGPPVRPAWPRPGQREAGHHSQLSGSSTRCGGAEAVVPRNVPRPPEYGHARSPTAAVVGARGCPFSGEGVLAPPARAHRRAGPRATHCRAVLEVVPSGHSHYRSNRPIRPNTNPSHHSRGATICMLIIQRPTVEAIGEEEDNRQRFAVGPLDPGFGHTLGNSLRRTLLSSIPGAAITQVRFDEALHEFTTLPGMKEDITDLILNLKDILIRVHSDEPVTVRLDKRGPGDATAGDLQLSSDVEVLSPTQHIASLNAKGRLAVDLTVERGRGYASADKNKRSSTIGVIPIDAIFSPVRRVAFTVEPVRVEQSTNFDRLVLDIETDGSLTPREALASAGDTLRTLVGLVADLEDEPQGLELGEVGAVGAGSPDLDLRIEDLDLTERPRNCLKRAQVITIGELVERTLDDLWNITNCGQKSLDEVVQKLDERGLALRVKD